MARPVRTLLLSDVHLGSKHTQTAQCLDFLKSYQPEQVYLVGDFIDGWRTAHGWHWTPLCDEVMDYFEDLMAKGTKVFYTPGNHDAFLRDIDGHNLIMEKFAGKFADVEIADQFVFETVRGWRLLVTHGDLFDVVETQAQWVSKITSIAYDVILSCNRLVNHCVGRRHRNPYGACAWLKSQVKRAIRFCSGFEPNLMQHARAEGCEGVICGHVHTPNMIHRPHLLYCNTGDWVENCTGLVEHHDGRISLDSIYGKTRTLELPQHHRAGDFGHGPNDWSADSSEISAGQLVG
ncbi:UDP-2,3-diacylglucosamine diphosphatase [Neorhodopirellula pilleata]|uniref:UDP-2,3-diacylglucosamine diphosphatase n=1 Tax=Neorhodopirellula pilleata TaxID=2714738 RepID=UPI001E383EE0|nr:UDP-2,3-diacylglucosamine diphosphatase [Neorhodopirellula pilleata]